MPRVLIHESGSRKMHLHEYSFTVVYEPLVEVVTLRASSGKRSRILAKNPAGEGYRVTVPLLPGLVTYGRSLQEAREMARDAIRCHLEGLQKDGEPIPNERLARTERLRVAIGA